jgi:hypothetical protein
MVCFVNHVFYPQTMARNVIVAVCFVTSWGHKVGGKKCVQVAVAEVGAEVVVVGKHLMTFWPGAPYCSGKKICHLISSDLSVAS